MTLLAFDSECDGLDFHHGVRPFFVTVCSEDGVQHFWQWDVDPLTRRPEVDEDDLDQLFEMLGSADRLVGHNSKYDVTALGSVRPAVLDGWPWDRTEDTLVAGHVLASNQPHNLTDMVMIYLDVDVEPLEKRLEEEVKRARAFCRGHLPSWKIARKDDPDAPSIKDKSWKSDGWLPRALARWEWESSMAFAAWREQGQTDDGTVLERKVAWLPGWECRPPELGGEDCRWTVLADYSNADSAVTVRLWIVLERLLRERDLWEIYRAKLATVHVAWEMEHRGVTVNGVELVRLREEFKNESLRCEKMCLQVAEDTRNTDDPWVNECLASLNLVPDVSLLIASDLAEDRGMTAAAAKLRAAVGWQLSLPKAGNNKSLTDFLLKGLRLPVRRWTANGNPCLDKNVLEDWEHELEPGTVEHLFIKSLRDKRKKDTSISYLESYQRFMLPLKERGARQVFNRDRRDGSLHGWFVLHPNANPCGTDTTRWSFNNPNSSNFSKQEVKCTTCDGDGCDMCDGTGVIDLNLRRVLGPAPGREWWALDAKNIERRIPAYKTGETEIIQLIERPDEPPYFGSEHGLVAHLLWPKEFKECGDDARVFKKRYAATLYQWVKNFNFATQYGCQERMGDKTAHQAGAWRKIKKRFAKQEQFNKHLIDFANKRGYVETVPDRSINPRRGYPLLCSRADNGFILPTVPMNYWCQGTACWAVSVRWLRLCWEQLQTWRRQEPEFDGFICLDVHDEIVFDLPKLGDPVVDAKLEKEQKRPLVPTPWCSNLWRIRVFQQLLRQVGDDIGVPLEAGAEFHEHNYATGVSL